MLTVADGSKHDWEGMSLLEVAEGNAMDVYFTLNLFNDMKRELEKENPNALKLCRTLFSPLSPHAARSEYDGFDICPERLEVLYREMMENTINFEDDVYNIPKVSPKLKISSAADLRQILFSEKGYGLASPYVTDKGKEDSTNDASLVWLTQQIERELQKRDK